MKNESINIKHSATSSNDSNTNITSFDVGAPARRPLTAPITINKPSSKAFDLKLSINPLAAAATPVITLCTKMQEAKKSPDFKQLRAALIHEIKVFEDKTRKLDYRSAVILAARYFLCTYIDEIISKNSQLQTEWKANPLLKSMQGEDWGGERFFLILERASDDAKGHIDLLELGFLFLNLGYQGRYIKSENNPRELEHIKDNLYVLIQKIRGEASSTLFIKSEQQVPDVPRKVKKRASLKFHYLAAAVVLVAGLTAVYVPYNAHLNKIAYPVIEKVNQLTQLSDSQTG